jgi:hypothetical protein
VRHGLARPLSGRKAACAKNRILLVFMLIWLVQSLAQKYSSFYFSEIDVHFTRSAPAQGAYRDRHERGAECGGRERAN